MQTYEQAAMPLAITPVGELGPPLIEMGGFIMDPQTHCRNGSPECT